MVNQPARERLVVVLQDFLAARTTNREFERSFEQVLAEHRGQDRGIAAVYGFFWNLYDDYEEHKLAGEWALELPVGAMAERCAEFLATNLEYRWKQSNFIGLDWRRMFSRILPWVKVFEEPVERFRQRIAQPDGDALCWPFFDTAEFEAKVWEQRTPILGPLPD